MATVNAIPIFSQFDAAAIKKRLDDHEFFWADLTLDEEARLSEIESVFELGREPGAALGHFPDPDHAAGRARRKVHVDADHVVFPFWYVANPDADIRGPPEAIECREVNVLLHADYLLTLHKQAYDLRELVGEELPSGRSERYVVYLVLEGMTSTFFHALMVLQDAMGELEADVLASEGRRHGDPNVLRGVRLRLTELRRVAGMERVLFERASGEVEQVSGLESDRRTYLDRINQQLDRVVDGIDAAGQELSQSLEVQLNEITYRLTIVATIFLPLTFLTGFFGMNFGWMVGEIDSAPVFWLLGVGGCLTAVALILGFLARQGILTRPRRR